MCKLICNLISWLAIAVGSECFAGVLYLPTPFEPSQARMVVVIHGCLQSAESMAFGTDWNRWADKHNLVVFYPQVPSGSHPLNCWSWYDPKNQRSDSGQLKEIADQIRSHQKTLRLKKRESFLAGISSGGATVAGLLACFPKMFLAGAIHSSPSYAVANSPDRAQKVLLNGPDPGALEASCQPRKFERPVIVVHGKLDTVVNPAHARRIISDFIGNTQEIAQKEYGEGRSSYSISDFRSSGGRWGRLVIVNDLDHSWSGAIPHLSITKILRQVGMPPPKIPFFSDFGPSATDLIWEFFSKVLHNSVVQPSESLNRSGNIRTKTQ